MQEIHRKLSWPVSARQTIAASGEDLWRAISTPGNLENGHPFCRKNPVHVWQGQRSRDEVHYLNGRIFERRFREWHEGVGYDLDIYERNRHRAAVKWRVTEGSDGSSTLVITVQPLLPGKWPIIVRWFAHWIRVKPFLRSYLRSVVMGFEWYVTKGEAVPRNHWGGHPWFSAD